MIYRELDIYFNKMASIKTYGYNEDSGKINLKGDGITNITQCLPYLELLNIEDVYEEQESDLYIMKIRDRYRDWMRKNLYSARPETENKENYGEKKARDLFMEEKKKVFEEIDKIRVLLSHNQTDFSNSITKIRSYFSTMEIHLTSFKLDEDSKNDFPQELFTKWFEYLREDFFCFHENNLTDKKFLNNYLDHKTFQSEYLVFIQYYIKKLELFLRILVTVGFSYATEGKISKSDYKTFDFDGIILRDKLLKLLECSFNNTSEFSVYNASLQKDLTGMILSYGQSRIIEKDSYDQKLKKINEEARKERSEAVADNKILRDKGIGKDETDALYKRKAAQIKENELLKISAVSKSKINFYKYAIPTLRILHEINSLIELLKKNGEILCKKFTHMYGGKLSEEPVTNQENFNIEENPVFEEFMKISFKDLKELNTYSKYSDDESNYWDLFFRSMVRNSKEENFIEKRKLVERKEKYVRISRSYFSNIVKGSEYISDEDYKTMFMGEKRYLEEIFSELHKIGNLFPSDFYKDDVPGMITSKMNFLLNEGEYFSDLPDKAKIIQYFSPSTFQSFDKDLENKAKEFNLLYINRNDPFQDLPQKEKIMKNTSVRKEINPKNPTPELINILNQLDSVIVRVPHFYTKTPNYDDNLSDNDPHNYSLTLSGASRDNYSQGAFFIKKNKKLEFVDTRDGDYGFVDINYNNSKKDSFSKKRGLDDITFISYFNFLGILKAPNYLLETNVTKNNGKYKVAIQKIDGSGDYSTPSPKNNLREILNHCHEYRERRYGNLYCIFYQLISGSYILKATDGKKFYSLDENSSLNTYVLEALRFVAEISKLDIRFKVGEITIDEKTTKLRTTRQKDDKLSVHTPNYFSCVSVLKPDDIFFDKDTPYPYDVKIIATNISTYYQQGIYKLHHKQIVKNDKDPIAYEEIKKREDLADVIPPRSTYSDRIWVKDFYLSDEMEGSRSLNLRSVEIHDSPNYADLKSNRPSGSLVVYSTQQDKIINILASKNLNIYEVAKIISTGGNISWAGHTVSINNASVDYFMKHVGNRHLYEILNNKRNVKFQEEMGVIKKQLSNILRSVANTIYCKMKTSHRSNTNRKIKTCYDFYIALNRPFEEFKFLRTKNREVPIDSSSSFVFPEEKNYGGNETFENENKKYGARGVNNQGEEKPEMNFFFTGRTDEQGISTELTYEKLIIGSAVLSKGAENFKNISFKGYDDILSKDKYRQFSRLIETNKTFTSFVEDRKINATISFEIISENTKKSWKGFVLRKIGSNVSFELSESLKNTFQFNDLAKKVLETIKDDLAEILNNANKFLNDHLNILKLFQTQLGEKINYNGKDENDVFKKFRKIREGYTGTPQEYQEKIRGIWQLYMKKIIYEKLFPNYENSVNVNENGKLVIEGFGQTREIAAITESLNSLSFDFEFVDDYIEKINKEIEEIDEIVAIYNDFSGGNYSPEIQNLISFQKPSRDFTNSLNEIYIYVPVREVTIKSFDKIRRNLTLDDVEFEKYDTLLDIILNSSETKLPSIGTIENEMKKNKNSTQKPPVGNELKLFLFIMIKTGSSNTAYDMTGLNVGQIEELIGNYKNRNNNSGKISTEVRKIKTDMKISYNKKKFDEGKGVLEITDEITNLVYTFPEKTFVFKKLVNMIEEQTVDPTYLNHVGILDSTYLTILESKLYSEGQRGKLISTLNKMYKKEQLEMDLGDYLHNVLSEYNLDLAQPDVIRELYTFFQITATNSSAYTAAPVFEKPSRNKNEAFIITRDFIEFDN